MKQLKPFYVDQRLIDDVDRPAKHLLYKLQFALIAYREVTGEAINVEELRGILPDPAAYWRIKKTDTNIAAQKSTTMDLLNEGFDIKHVRSMLKLPENFQRVIDACRAITEKVEWKNLETFEGNVSLVLSLNVRHKQMAFLYARTEEQLQRLEYSRQVIALLQKGAEFLKQQAVAVDGLDQQKLQAVIDHNAYHGDLPLSVMLRPETSKGNGIPSHHLVPNPQWVLNGFRLFTPSGLPNGLPTMAFVSDNGPRYTFVVIMNPDESIEYLLYESEGFDKDHLPGQAKRAWVDPNEYVIKEGKLVNFTVVRNEEAETDKIVRTAQRYMDSNAVHTSQGLADALRINRDALKQLQTENQYFKTIKGRLTA